MKYICLGYLEPGKFENMSESERNTMLDECFSYNDELRKNGHLVAEEPLQPANTAVTVGWKNGKVAVTDGPYAETKEAGGPPFRLEVTYQPLNLGAPPLSAFFANRVGAASRGISACLRRHAAIGDSISTTP